MWIGGSSLREGDGCRSQEKKGCRGEQIRAHQRGMKEDVERKGKVKQGREGYI